MATVAQKYDELADHAKVILPGKEEFGDLLVWLNQNGHQTISGTPYTGNRGVARMVSAAWHYHDRMGNTAERDAIQKAFVNQNYTYSYDNY